MVFFVLSRSGFDELLLFLGQSPDTLWVNAGVLSDIELSRLRADGVDVTNVSAPIAAQDAEAVAVAVSIIKLHHPGETIWIEYVARL